MNSNGSLLGSRGCAGWRHHSQWGYLPRWRILADYAPEHVFRYTAWEHASCERSIIGAPTFNVISWASSPGAVTKSRNSAGYWTASSWLRTVLTDYYVHSSLSGRETWPCWSVLLVRSWAWGWHDHRSRRSPSWAVTNPGVNTVDQLFLWFDDFA